MAGKTVNMLIMRLHDRALADAAPIAHGVMLDIGCGKAPYRALFAPYVVAHIGLDHEATPHGLQEADLIGSAYDIPAADDSYDTVLCTSVLEHLEEPALALAEARRVLADGGAAIYTVPMTWHLHEEPRDFYRYTKHGLQYLFASAGFAVDKIQPIGGFWVSVGQALSYYVYRLHRGPFRTTRLVPALAILIQALAGQLDRLDPAEEWTCLYLVTARVAV